MKIIVTLLGLLNGLFMLADGIYVILNGKYIGPAKPGPWSNLFYKLNIDVFRLGPMFIIFGILWLTFLFGLWTNQTWTYALGLAVCFLTLWYLPIGTIISITILIILLTSKVRLGL